MSIIKRKTLGRPLTFDELDSNFEQVDSLVASASTTIQIANTQAKAAADFANAASQSASMAATSAENAGGAITRSLRVPEGETLNELAPLINRANSVQLWDSMGQPALRDLSSFATLDNTGKLPLSNIPAAAITEVYPVTSQASMLALSADPGDVAIVNNADDTAENGSFILMAAPSSVLANWKILSSNILIQLSLDNGASLVGAKGEYTGETGTDLLSFYNFTTNVKRWGAKGDGVSDDTSAIQSAIDNIPSGSSIIFPRGDFIHTTALTISNKIIYLVGQGRGATRLINTSNISDGVVYDLNFAQGGGVQGISVTAKSATSDQQSPGSTGTGIKVINSNDNFHCDDFEVLRYDTGVSVKASFQPYFSNFRILWFRNAGVHLLPYTGASGEVAGNGSQFTIGKIGNTGFTVDSSSSVGILIQYGSGEFFSDIDVQKAGYGLIFAPTSTSWVRHIWMNNVLGDTSDNTGWEIDQTSGGDLRDLMLNNCWSSYSGTTGVVVKGNPSDIRWQGGTIRDNNQFGLQISGGTFMDFNNTTINNNSKSSTLTYDGVAIDGSVNNLSFNGCTIGNMPSFNTHLQGNGIQIYNGVNILNFRLVNNDLSSYGTGKTPVLLAGNTAVSGVMSGNLPLRTKPINNSLRQLISVNSATAVPASTTTFIAPYGTTSQVNAAAVLLKSGIITQIEIGVSNNPVTSFTYSLFVNGTSYNAGTISGNNYTAVTELNIPVNDGDNVYLQVVTASGSNASYHRAAIIHTP